MNQDVLLKKIENLISKKKSHSRKRPSRMIVEVPEISLQKLRVICSKKKITQKDLINKYIDKIINKWEHILQD